MMLDSTLVDNIIILYNYSYHTSRYIHTCPNVFNIVQMLYKYFVFAGICNKVFPYNYQLNHIAISLSTPSCDDKKEDISTS